MYDIETLVFNLETDMQDVKTDVASLTAIVDDLTKNYLELSRVLNKATECVKRMATLAHNMSGDPTMKNILEELDKC